MDLAPLFGLILCIAVLSIICTMIFVVVIFSRAYRAQKTMHQKFDNRHNKYLR